MKKSKKLRFGLLMSWLITACLSVIACQQDPFKTLPKAQQITVLLNASRAAEKALGVFRAPGGSYYLSCMEHFDTHIDCHQFFALMLAAVHKDPRFATVTYPQLTSVLLFDQLAADYQATFFNSVDED